MSLASLLSRDEMIALSVKLLERSAAAMNQGVEQARQKHADYLARQELQRRLDRIKARVAAMQDET